MPVHEYPPVGFHFRVVFELSGTTDNDTRFQEVAGLNAELAVETLVEGGENRFSHRLPVRTKYPNLVLKRGLTTNTALAGWCRRAVRDLDIEPVSVLVELLDETHQPRISWSVVGAWPVKWSLSSFNAQANTIAVESLELAYQYFEQISP